MNEKEAKELYYSVMRDGAGEYRDNFLDSIGDMEFGLIGETAKDLRDKRDGAFMLGVDIGIMIGLSLIFGIRKVSK